MVRPPAPPPPVTGESTASGGDGEVDNAAVFDGDGTARAVASLAGVFLAANRAFLDMTGFSLPELRRLTMFQVCVRAWRF